MRNFTRRLRSWIASGRLVDSRVDDLGTVLPLVVGERANHDLPHASSCTFGAKAMPANPASYWSGTRLQVRRRSRRGHPVSPTRADVRGSAATSNAGGVIPPSAQCERPEFSSSVRSSRQAVVFSNPEVLISRGLSSHFGRDHQNCPLRIRSIDASVHCLFPRGQHEPDLYRGLRLWPISLDSG
jgi:hypothetical protein